MKRLTVMLFLSVFLLAIVLESRALADDVATAVDTTAAEDPAPPSPAAPVPATPVTVACGDSISDAVNQAPPGSTITVTGPCTYAEYIVVFRPNQTINTSGGTVVAQGIDFTADGNNGTLNGTWTFTNNSNDAGTGWGIHIEANNTTIDGSIAIDGVCFEGIYVEPSISGVTINRVSVNNSMIAGIHLDGTSTRLTSFRITNVVERRDGCPDQTTADYIHFANSGSVGGVPDSGGEIGNGYMDGTVGGSAANPEYSTLSCYVVDGGPANGWIIHDNICYFAAQDYQNADECGAELDDSLGVVQGISLWNNIFAHMTRGIDIANSRCANGQNCSSVNVMWQTFVDIAQEAIVARGSSGFIQNNIFYNVGSGADDYACSLDNASLSSNVFYAPDGQYGTYCGPWPSVSADPHFPNTTYGRYDLTTSLPAGFHAP